MSLPLKDLKICKPNLDLSRNSLEKSTADLSKSYLLGSMNDRSLTNKYT